MFSSLTQIFKSNQGLTNNINDNNKKNEDSNFGSNFLNGYNNQSLNQIFTGTRNAYLSKDLIELGKSSVRLDDKKVYRQLLNLQNKKTFKSTLPDDEIEIKPHFSPKMTKNRFNFLFKKNEDTLRKQWYRPLNEVDTSKPFNLFGVHNFKSFYQPQSNFPNFTIEQRISLVEKLQKLEEEEKNVKIDTEIKIENKINEDQLQKKILAAKSLSNDFMEYDENHFGDSSKGASSLCISEPWEDVMEDMDIDLPDFSKNYKEISSKIQKALDTNFKEKFEEELEKSELQGKSLEIKNHKNWQEKKEFRILSMKELEQTRKSGRYQCNSLSKLKYIPKSSESKLSDDESISDLFSEDEFEDDFEDDFEFKEEAEEESEEEFEITDKILEKVNEVLSIQDSNAKITSKYNSDIRRKDIETLQGLNWLNDEIINFYFNMIMERSQNTVYCFNTFFYSKLKDSGHKSLRRWTKKVDIFSYEKLLIPVHLGMHWTLACIEIKTKNINYYDSMNGNNQECLNLLLGYLKDELKDKKNNILNVSEWRLTNVKGMPQQMNGSDCGMFTCKYADYLSRNKKFTFSQNHMPYFRTRMIYEIVTGILLSK